MLRFEDIAPIRKKLLAWYRRDHRAMPWRAERGDTPNPYHVMVSEAMLQQTQVATVIDYFNRFVTALPTVEALAAADEQRVLRLWQGLGYYRRARRLHRAARVIVEQHNGRVPDDVDALRALPGVGRYTAGAIASIAYGRAEPVVDGNVMRVLARLGGCDEPIDDKAVQQRMWDTATALLPRARKGSYAPGELNQSLMELGATVCTPRNARCLVCPVRELCEAAATGRVDELPIKAGRTKQTDVTHRVIAVSRGGKLLFEQRPDDGLWSGMWQMPTVEVGTRNAERGSGSDADLVSWLSERYGLRVNGAGVMQVGSFIHMTTHRRITFEVYHAGDVAGRLRPNVAAWRAPGDTGDLPMSNPQRRVLRLLTGE
ncbi:MAG: A/G-specific adenine glycosylase [Phycisphaera sp.]|nr:A/G-specific adenine glycosylase [Phycisphaera sp.]